MFGPPTPPTDDLDDWRDFQSQLARSDAPELDSLKTLAAEMVKWIETGDGTDPREALIRHRTKPVKIELSDLLP